MTRVATAGGAPWRRTTLDDDTGGEGHQAAGVTRGTRTLLKELNLP